MIKKWISIVYELCFCSAVIFFIYLLSFSGNDLYVAKRAEGYIKLSNHSFQVQEDAAAPVGI